MEGEIGEGWGEIGDCLLGVWGVRVRVRIREEEGWVGDSFARGWGGWICTGDWESLGPMGLVGSGRKGLVQKLLIDGN